MKEQVLAPVKKNKRLSHQIEERIKKAIFNQDFIEGEKIPSERELSDIFGASRLIVREALRTLESKGLLEIRKGVRGGGYVRKISSEPVIESLKNMIGLNKIDINTIAEARLSIEPNICVLAARNASSKDIENLVTINKRLKKAFRSGESDVENDPGIHTVIAEIAGNKVLQMIAEALLEIHTYSMRDVKLDEEAKLSILSDHANIISAIGAKEDKKAHDLMVHHIESVRHHLNRIKNAH